MQIHNLPAQTSAANTDALAIDNGSTTQKITVANLGKKVTEDATPAFTSADSTTANAWTSVAALASGETMKSILNKVSTMFKNIRYLYKMLGTTDISSLSDAGTVTAALSQLNTEINTLNTYVTTNLTYTDSSSSSTEQNAPWMILKNQLSSLPYRSMGMINAGSIFFYIGFKNSSGNYGSWLVWTYNLKFYIVDLNNGTWRYKALDVSNPTTF